MKHTIKYHNKKHPKRKTRKIFAGDISYHKIFNKILSIGYEIETTSLVKFSKMNDGITDYFMNTDTNAKDISMFESGGNEYIDEDELLVRMEEYYNIDIGKNATFYITNDVSTTSLGKRLETICPNVHKHGEEEEEEQEGENQDKDELYTLKLYETDLPSEYPIKFFFNEDADCSVFSDVEWIITYYQPKNDANIILNTFIQTVKHLIRHLDELVIATKKARLILHTNNDAVGDIEIDAPLNRILFHKPNTNLYYMQSRADCKNVNDITTSIQMTFGSHAEYTFQIMKQIMMEPFVCDDDKNSCSVYYFDKIERCVNELIQSPVLSSDFANKIKTAPTKLVNEIKCFIACILYKLYVYYNIHLQKQSKKYFKNSFPLNVRHSNYVLYNELKKCIIELGIKDTSDASVISLVQQLIIQEDVLLKYLVDDVKYIRKNAFRISNRLDKVEHKKNYGNPVYSLVSYFDFFENPIKDVNEDSDIEIIHHDWFEYIKLDTFSTKMEISADRVLLVESRNFPKLIKKHIQSVYNLTDDSDRLSIGMIRKFIDNQQTLQN
jgi:hypothetical protein